MKILIDAFGGDNAPKEIVIGAVDALKLNNNFTIGLVGKKAEIEKVLSLLDYEKARVEIYDAKDVITCEEEPTVAIRSKPESSLCVAFKLLKDGMADAFVSAGSTGAVLVGSTLKVGRIKGISRPALCPILPTVGENKVLLLDAGANTECKAINLAHFAIMGALYSKLVLGVENPKVALLSNGTEDKKGNALCHEVFPILKSIKEINFVGNVEARDIPSGNYDVVVADGFSGNIALKSMEGGVSSLMTIIKAELLSSLKGKIGALILKSSFKKIKNKMDFNSQGGAVFLGVDKVVVKAHGSAKRLSITNSVLQAKKIVEENVTAKIRESLEKINLEELNEQ